MNMMAVQWYLLRVLSNNPALSELGATTLYRHSCIFGAKFWPLVMYSIPQTLQNVQIEFIINNILFFIIVKYCGCSTLS